MAPAAVWSDVRTVPGRQFRGRVDGLIGGIPCQPHSLAGRRGGSTDERDLWSPARRIIAQARPWFVLIENVAGFLSAGADEIPGAARVRRDLRKLGFQSALVLVRADQMGLPHERLRAFILGVADWFMADGDCNGRQGGKPSQPPAAERRRSGDGGVALADGDSKRRRPRQPQQAGRGKSVPAERGDIVANGVGSRLEGCGSSGSGPGERPALERGREHLADSNVVELRRVAPAGEQPLVQQDHGTGPLDDASRRDGRLHPRPRLERLGTADAGRPVEVVDADGGGRDGRPEGEVGEPERRGPDERSGGRPFLRPPGPGDVDAWRHVALVAPGLLPAVSRYDRLRLEMGAAGFVAAGDPSSGRQSRAQARKARRGAGQGASHWLDAASGDAMGSADVQAAIERALRGVADVLAPRIDELRMLGNGVADAQGALAVRIGVRNLHASGSAGAAFLMALMGEA